MRSLIGKALPPKAFLTSGTVGSGLLLSDLKSAGWNLEVKDVSDVSQGLAMKGFVHVELTLCRTGSQCSSFRSRVAWQNMV